MAVAAGVVLCASMVPSTADAATSGVPMTCGMVVTDDAMIYLQKDLHCTDFAVRATGVFPDGNLAPRVIVDLRGHTLSGPGSGSGITAFGNTITAASLEVKNGRIQGWDVGVGGDSVTSVKNVVLTKNRVGFFCNGTCSAEASLFSKNTEEGFFAGGESEATVTRSFFYKNKTGAVVLSLPFSLHVSKSVFLANETGVAGYSGASLSVSRSTFIKNRTGVLYQVVDEAQCVALYKNRFVRNGVNVNGPAC